jgi:glycerol-3-phosphate acyltransferase PlsY
MFESLLLVIGSYLLGSISSAILVCRVAGLPDPREQGSGNPGATNMLRLHGKKLAAVTLVGDFLKGLIPLLIGRFFSVPDLVLAGMGTAAFLGHLYPVFFGFHGGKGVATFAGVLFGLAWPAGVAYFLVWTLTARLFRYSSLGALVAAGSSPVFVYLSHPSPVYLWAIGFMAIFLFWRHRTNIRNLLAREEKQIGAK